MKTSQDALSILVRHFSERGWPPDMHERKLYNRARVTFDEATPHIAIVEIERHRAILGTSYTRGVGMDAFQTYFMRYSVDTTTSNVNVLEEREGGYQIDASGVVDSHLDRDSFSLSIEPLGDGRYKIRESETSDSAVVSSVQEAIHFSLAIGDMFQDSFAEQLRENWTSGEEIPASEKEEIIAEYNKCLNVKLEELARRTWENREDDF